MLVVCVRHNDLRKETRTNLSTGRGEAGGRLTLQVIYNVQPRCAGVCEATRPPATRQSRLFQSARAVLE